MPIKLIGGIMGSFIAEADEIAVEAERKRLHELAGETGLGIDIIAANQVTVYRKSLYATRESLAKAVDQLTRNSEPV